MENTTENKEKFFAQYWGQSVLREDYCDWLFAVGDLPFSKDKLEISSLELKPLQSITDEDAKWLCNHFGWLWHEDYPNDDGESSLDRLGVVDLGLMEVFDCGSDSGYKLIEVIDYLRSKGYVLPWMGISVEQQIEWGWIKLKTCKHIKREGESCSLNNNCKYPKCIE